MPTHHDLAFPSDEHVPSRRARVRQTPRGGRWRRRSALLASLLLATAFRASATTTHFTATGFTRLEAEYGGSLPTGSGIAVTHVEASTSSSTATFSPDTTNAEFTGKTFTLATTSDGTSGHATTVGQFYYGLTSSFTPGVTAITVYNADNWVSTGYLKVSTSSLPATDTHVLQNHSWIGDFSSTDPAYNTEALRRLDYAVARDGALAVVGVNNGTSTTLPPLLCQAYHVISVGRSDGVHSAGFTTYDGTGRVKPEIVAPGSATSYATPMVSSAALLLRAEAKASSALTLADDPRVVKALLLATATKTDFSSWSHTTTQPLDSRYGAGQLNISLAYGALVEGRQAASTSTDVATRGWDRGSTGSPATAQLYFFDIPTGQDASRFSAVLTWYRNVTTTTSGVGPFATRTWDYTLPNVNLRLYTASGYTISSLVAESVSTVDNLQLLSLDAPVPGRYALEVSSTTTSLTYGLAWTSVPTISITTVTHGGKLDGTPATFLLSRTGDTSQPLTVPYSVSGSAAGGTDFTPVASGSALIPAGSSSVTLTYTPTGTAPLDDDTLTLALTSDFASAVSATQGSATANFYGSAYESWLTQYFDAASIDSGVSTAPTADPDLDGATNLQEFAFASDPQLADTPSDNEPVLAVSGAHLTISFVRPEGRASLTYVVEWSSDLTTWFSDTDHVVGVADEIVASGERFTYQATAQTDTYSYQYLRVRVTNP